MSSAAGGTERARGCERTVKNCTHGDDPARLQGQRRLALADAAGIFPTHGVEHHEEFTESIGPGRASLTAMIGGLMVSGPAHAEAGTASSAFTGRAGALDAGFGVGGTVTTELGGPSDRATALVVQPDGKLVAAGAGGDLDVALARYNPDGSLDSTFGIGGKATTDFAGGYDRATALVLQADGKLVAAGVTGLGPSHVILARYDPDGTLDASFGTGGTVTSEVSGIDRANDLA